MYVVKLIEASASKTHKHKAFSGKCKGKLHTNECSASAERRDTFESKLCFSYGNACGYAVCHYMLTRGLYLKATFVYLFSKGILIFFIFHLNQ